MSLIGTLAVNVIANTAAMEQGLKKAQGKVTAFSSEMDKIASSVGLGGAYSSLKAMNSAASSLAGEFAPVLSIVESVSEALAEGARKADELAESADKIGVKASRLDGLRAAAAESGAKAESLDMALMKLNERLGEVQLKNREAAASFEKVGLDPYRLAAMGTADAFKAIANRVQEIHDPMERAAVLAEIFGKQGRELGPLLSQGAAGIDKAVARAKELGLVANDGIVKAAGEANDAAERAAKAWEVAMMKAAAASKPLLDAWHELSRIAAIATGDIASGGSNAPTMQVYQSEASKKKAKEQEEAKAVAMREAVVEEELQKQKTKQMDDLRRKADQLNESLRTPEEIYKDQIAELEKLNRLGMINANIFRRGEEQARAARDKSKVKSETFRQVDNPSRAAGSQEAFAAWARQQNAISGFGGDKTEKEIEKNTGEAADSLKEVKLTLTKIEAKPAITFKVVNL